VLSAPDPSVRRPDFIKNLYHLFANNNAERVVVGARHMSPFLGGRMLAGRLLNRAVFIRELLPQDLKLEIETLSRDEAMNVAEFLARVVGRGHARQMRMPDCQQWLAELQKNRSNTRPMC
jgi:uncharacterized protein (DUF2252 family)